MADNIDRNEPYEVIMERLSKGISSWNFNFGSPESRPEAESPACEEISHCNEILAPLAKSRLIPLLSALAVAFLVLVAGVKGMFWQDQKGKFKGEAIGNLNQQKQPIGMARVEPLITNGTIELSISTVEENKLVSFEYGGSGKQIPLLAFQTPSGKIETAVGVSWPCGSKSFHIEGAEIVCDLCLTRWDLETLKGVHGECLDHPLDKVMHTVRDGRLMIREADIQEWKPRMIRG